MDAIQGFLLVLYLSILPSSVHSVATNITVDTGSCNETSPDMYLNPGDTVVLNCNVSNPLAASNFLIWNIPNGDDLFLGTNNPDASNSVFSATRTSITDTTISSQLMFTAIDTLDEEIVTCRDFDSPINKDTCTLLVKTLPTEPLDLVFTRKTFNSCELEWNPPSDIGDESISHYSIIGTPDDISDITEDTMIAIMDLTPITIYTFNVSANNSLGFGDSASVQCTTTGNDPPRFTNIIVKLGFNEVSGDTELYIMYSPCPILITDIDNTPPVDNYTVTVNTTDPFSVDVSPDTCDYTIQVSEDNIYTVEMSVNNIIGSTKTTAPPFIASWIRNDKVIDITNTSAKIVYTTAERVVPDDLMVEFNISDTTSIINSSCVSYETNKTVTIPLTDLQPNDVLNYTIQAVSECGGMAIGMSRTGSFTVLFTPSPTTTTSVSTTSTSMTTSPSVTTLISSPTSTPTPTETEEPTLPIAAIAGGVVGGAIAVLVIIIIVLVLTCCCCYEACCHCCGIIFFCICCCLKNRKKSVDLIGTRRDKEDPIPLVEKSQPLPETGQGLYQDPSSIEHQHAPTGDLYALPEKKGSRRQPPSAPKETATYQDPDTIQRQQAPTGDLYALPEKKPVYTQVNKENKSQGATYAELGFHDQHPPTSPTGAPLISPTPHDTTVLYAEVQQQQ